MAQNGAHKRERVALMLAGGASIKRTAAKCKVGRRTIHRWLESAEFRQSVSEQRTKLFNKAVGRLSRIAGKAATVLDGLLQSDDDRIRLQAAKIVLETGIRAREALDHSVRLDALEKRINEDNSHESK